MRLAILDPSAGISGDMVLGALIGAGVERAWLESLPARLGFSDVKARIRAVARSGVAAIKVDFEIPAVTDPAAHGRHVAEMIEIVRHAPLSSRVKAQSVKAFELLEAAEGKVHGVPAEHVHLHEVGAVDAVLDIVGAFEGFEQLGVDEVYNLPVAIGSGWVEAEHGKLPVPAPATAILLEGMELMSGGPVQGEATTPTGATVLRTLSRGRPPDRWRLVKSAWGAGERNPGQYPNALRLILAEPAAEAGVVEVIATDLDDMQPEYVEPLREALFAAGALDCAVWAAGGKKGRVSLRLEAQVAPGDAERVVEALFTHSTTVGVRRWSAVRSTLPRREVSVELAPSVVVRTKVWDRPTGVRIKPEFDDVVRAAAALRLPAVEVARRAQLAAEAVVNDGQNKRKSRQHKER
ncbi:MAG: nickel pincer cofactor biosynthesis protein LarC [Gemmatimonadetes bacterium]|nr:nickel pincer cofactor biosynthesis protein LarC [Gemmatimonadota bacterium]